MTKGFPGEGHAFLKKKKFKGGICHLEPYLGRYCFSLTNNEMKKNRKKKNRRTEGVGRVFKDNILQLIKLNLGY